MPFLWFTVIMTHLVTTDAMNTVLVHTACVHWQLAATPAATLTYSHEKKCSILLSFATLQFSGT
jgi:hypothetical protein